MRSDTYKQKNIQMKKAIVIIVVVIAAIAIWAVSGYNGLVSAEENVKSAWSQVENVYQRRLDLIPNLVATVKGYAEHEQETLEGVIAARSKATQITVDPDQLSEESIAAFQEAQGEIGAALGRLLAISENYPDLKANRNFSELQAELAGTENRIATERRKYNEVAKAYNTMVRRFRAMSSLPCSVSGRKDISRLLTGLPKHLRWNSDKIRTFHET